MKKIIPPVDVAILKSQLKQEYFLRTTNHGNNQIYVVDNTNAPDVLRDIGRLREEAFRAGGGGTGQELDLDRFDLDPAYGYKQLVLYLFRAAITCCVILAISSFSVRSAVPFVEHSPPQLWQFIPSLFWHRFAGCLPGSPICLRIWYSLWTCSLSNSFGSAPTTSANPPVLTNGTPSLDAYRIRFIDR